MGVSFSHKRCQNKSFVIKASKSQMVPRDFDEMARLMSITALAGAPRRARNRSRVLWVACAAHALHDGLTDTLYLLLPLWQAQFALSYAAIGLLRALYTGAMAGLQVPAAGVVRWMGGPATLAAGTAVAAAGYLLFGASAGVPMLAVALVVGGIGSSVQHPIASSLVAAAYEGQHSRSALGTYNFAGDIGKMALPAIVACLIAVVSWRLAASTIGLIGLASAGAILLALRPASPAGAAGAHQRADSGKAHGAGKLPHTGFPLLLSIGVIDSATRMGFLTFLPFLLRAKGAAVPEVGFALTMIFAGGAAGKLVCGFLGARVGVLATVFVTEGATAAGILALLPLPLGAAFAVLPIIGVALNGTSSVLYGTVPELVPAHQRERAFGVFYTGAIGAGALAPALYGLLGDAIGLSRALILVAAIVLLTLPLARRLMRVIDARPCDADPQGAERTG
jgi:MFS transporter, FSR family, fosmidomycin resistance protein